VPHSFRFSVLLRQEWIFLLFHSSGIGSISLLSRLARSHEINRVVAISPIQSMTCHAYKATRLGEAFSLSRIFSVFIVQARASQPFNLKSGL
jgi:hypothetical protein